MENILAFTCLTLEFFFLMNINGVINSGTVSNAGVIQPFWMSAGTGSVRIL